MWSQLRAKHRQEAGWVMKLEVSLPRTYSSEATLPEDSTAFAHSATSSGPSVQIQKSHIRTTSLTYKHYSPLQLSATAGGPVTQEHPENVTVLFREVISLTLLKCLSTTSIPRHPTIVADREPQASDCHQVTCCSARDECELNINYALYKMIYLTLQLNKNICIPQQVNILK